MFFDPFLVCGVGLEFAVDDCHFFRDAVLFSFEELEGDGVGVVGFEELVAFVG